MKVFDSGMPEETYWNSLFDVEGIVDWLDLNNLVGPIVEIGCGYGTFTVPIAKQTNEKIFAFDMDPAMLETAQKNVRHAKRSNVQFSLRDVLEEGTGLESGSAGLVLLFNILHFHEKDLLLKEASRILKRDGVAAIIHWRKDIQTPRGPILSMRPDPQEILNAVSDLDLHFKGNSKILEPYHWGIQLIRGT